MSHPGFPSAARSPAPARLPLHRRPRAPGAKDDRKGGSSSSSSGGKEGSSLNNLDPNKADFSAYWAMRFRNFFSKRRQYLEDSSEEGGVVKWDERWPGSKGGQPTPQCGSGAPRSLATAAQLFPGMPVVYPRQCGMQAGMYYVYAFPCCDRPAACVISTNPSTPDRHAVRRSQGAGPAASVGAPG